MLHTAIDEQEGKIILLSHDGFVVKKPINLEPIKRAFNVKTGLRLLFKARKHRTKPNTQTPTPRQRNHKRTAPREYY